MYCLKKALCCLKLAPWTWIPDTKWFYQVSMRNAIYVKKNDDNVLIVSLCVNDLLFSGNCRVCLMTLRLLLINEFEMTEYGLKSFLLGSIK